MSPGVHTERAFEDRVEYELLRHGWERASGLYSAEMGIYTGALWEFVGRTQVKKWNKLIELYGGDPDVAMRQFALRVASEIDSRGVLDVLRQGVKDRGVQIELAYFRPGHTLAEGALDEYNANILAVARQHHFSFRDASLSVDMAFFVNGLPVATAELKNPNTGQNADHAVAQYRGPGPERSVLRQARPRALRCRSGPRLHHDAAQGAGYRVPAVQRRVQRGRKGWRGGEPEARSGY